MSPAVEMSAASTCNGVNFPELRYQTNGQMRRIAPAVWGVWHHAITTIAFYTRGHSTRQRVRDCDLKELAMPDLDQIKQAEQGARDRRGRFARGRPGNPAGRAAASTALPGYCSLARASR
jgi:hypothetical protein